MSRKRLGRTTPLSSSVSGVSVDGGPPLPICRALVFPSPPFDFLAFSAPYACPRALLLALIMLLVSQTAAAVGEADNSGIINNGIIDVVVDQWSL